jgi:hypothetical protein
MKIRHLRNSARLGTEARALSTLLVGFAAADTGLATADQQSVETRALEQPGRQYHLRHRRQGSRC